MNTELLNKDKKVLSQDKFIIVGYDSELRDNVTYKRLNNNKLAWLKFKNNKVAVVSVFLLIIMLIVSFSSPLWAADQLYTIDDARSMNHSSDAEKEILLKEMTSRKLFKENFNLVNTPPSSQHIFGTDKDGVDIFANTFVRLRLSIFLGVIVALLNTFIGIIYGGISGYMGGMIDDIMMRIIEIISSIPNLLWVSVIVIVIGNSFKSLVIAMGLFGWCKTAMIIRGKVCQLREQEFILASKALGADYERIVMGHMLPNCMPLAITSFTNDVPGVILDEAVLSCIGLGIMIPYFTLGKMLFMYTQSGVLLFYAYQIIIPSLVLTLVILLFQYVGTAISDALDPKIVYHK